MIARPSTIPGCFSLDFEPHHDARGSFVKPYRRSELEGLGLNANFVESYYTVSATNVLRGMHLQLPPAEHSKLVYCTSGKVLDVWLDARVGSPTYGKWAQAELDAVQGCGLYLPAGVAHGFCVLDGPATMVYHVTSEYAPGHDAGIAWDSFGAAWPLLAPLISERDATLPRWEDFDSPFCYSCRANRTQPIQAES